MCHTRKSLGLFVSLATLVGCSGGSRGGEAHFTQPMPIPPILAPTSVSGNAKTFALVAQKGRTSFIPGTVTETYGYNGNLLGPTIRVQQGDQLTVRVANQLDEVTTFHWHGVTLPGMADGAMTPINPGDTWTSQYTVNQPAATLWYHPHPYGNTGFQAIKGLAGFLLVDDPTSLALPLPKTYGVDDFPLAIQDKRFHADGSLSYMDLPTDGDRMFGNSILVNGVINPYLDLPAGLVRLRVLNGSNARTYNLGFPDGRTFYQIASDDGLLTAPAPVTNLMVAPAERVEILVNLSQDAIGSVLYLNSLAFPVPANEGGPNPNGAPFPILQLRVSRPGTAMAVPSALALVPRLQESEASLTRTFLLEGTGDSQINGKLFDPDRIDFTASTDAVEIWEVTNGAPDFAHPFHIHGLQFQILDRTSRPLEPGELGWKDTIRVLPGEKVRLIMKLRDMMGRYMFHCHILEHEDRGMMGQFLVQ